MDELRSDYSGRRIQMRADRVINMMSKSIVIPNPPIPRLLRYRQNRMPRRHSFHQASSAPRSYNSRCGGGKSKGRRTRPVTCPMEPEGRSPKGSMGRRASTPWLTFAASGMIIGLPKVVGGFVFSSLRISLFGKSVRPGLMASFLPLVVAPEQLSLQQQGSCTVVFGQSSHLRGCFA